MNTSLFSFEKLEDAACRCNILAYGAETFLSPSVSQAAYLEVMATYAKQTRHLSDTYLSQAPIPLPPVKAEQAALQNAREYLASCTPSAAASGDLSSASVVTPFYGHLEFFHSCALSVWDCFSSSPGIKAEWLVVNDDPRIPDSNLHARIPEQLRPLTRILGDGSNKGISSRLNEGINNAQGNWILFLDCDDRIDARALSVLAAYVRRFPQCRYISSGMRDIDAAGNILRLRLRRETPVDLCRDYMTAGHLKAVRSDTFTELGLLDGAYEGCQDFEFALRTALHEPILYIPEFLYDYRWHGASQSVAHAGRQIATARSIVHHVVNLLPPSVPTQQPTAIVYSPGEDRPTLTADQLAAWRMELLEYAPHFSEADASDVEDVLYILGLFIHAAQYPFLSLALDEDDLAWLRQADTDGIPRWMRVLADSKAFKSYGMPTAEGLTIHLPKLQSSGIIFPPALALCLGPEMLSQLCQTQPAIVPELADAGIPLFLQALYFLRPDLQRVFSLDADGTKGLLCWWRNSGAGEYPFFSSELSNSSGKQALAEDSSRKRAVQAYKDSHSAWRVSFDGLFQREGINITGYATLALGISEDVRMAAKAMSAVSVPYCLYEPSSVTRSHSAHPEMALHVAPYPNYATNLVFLPGVETFRLHLVQGSRFFGRRYTICAWQWELPRWPERLAPCLDLAQEIWVSTEFTASSLRERASVPLMVMPMAVSLPPFIPCPRSAFDLPEDAFCFLFVYDGLSQPKRKNPMAVITAFQVAFPKESNVRLIVKSMNAGLATMPGKRMEEAAAKDPRIVLIAETMPQDRLLALYQTCDAYVSLHRAEGFGRTLAEAMLLGKPVIASNFSGNTDFCTPETAFMVAGDMVPLAEGDYFFGEGQHWFDPSPDDAAVHMRRCLEDPDGTRLLAKAGQKFIRDKYSPEAVGLRYRARLVELGILSKQ